MPVSLNRRKKRALLAVAIAVPVLVAALGVPAVLSKAGDPIPGVDDVERTSAAALDQVAGTNAAEEAVLLAAESAGVDAAAAALAATDRAARGAQEERTPGLTPSVDGDLHVTFELGPGTPHANSTIRAKVLLSNLSLEDFHVPAADEPQPTLAVVVIDAAGEEVRRIVESSDDGLPRRLRLLRSGERLELDVSIVADGEEGLAPGAYRAYAEFGSDAAWSLTGLPCYTARAAPPRSEWLAFDVVD